MAFDVTAWMPPEMSPEEQAAWLAAYPDDPHMAAGMAWESHAAALMASGTSSGLEKAVTSISTGAQSITYAKPVSLSQAASDVAAWHFLRSRRTAVRSPDYPATGATGATDPQGEQGLGILTGTGSPLSVVTPDFVGQTYADDAATTGARLWVATGATSADWTVIAGDTGWRDVTAAWVPAATLTADPNLQLLVRRINEAVFWALDTGASATSGTGLAMVADGIDHGWRFSDTTGIFHAEPLLRTDNHTFTTASFVRLIQYPNRLYRRWTTANVRYTGRLRALTADPWPTTLPGTAV